MRLVELYEPYVLFKGMYVLNSVVCCDVYLPFWKCSILHILHNTFFRFDDRNTKGLCANQKEDETKNSKGSMFDFDPKGINWGDYLTSVHIPGLITHVLKK